MRIIPLFMILLSGCFSSAQTVHYLTIRGVVWQQGAHFKTGVIDVDLRGRNVDGESFLGMAFSGKDSNDLECLYFRPFNFRATDSLKKQHMVQYMSLPDHDWKLLRTTSPLVFEQGIQPPPDPNDWFHASIHVSNDSVQVFVNHSKVPSLSVRRFKNHTGDQIGLWCVGLPGDFNNLEIH